MNGRTHALDERQVVLGRSKECDVQVADANVSRRHAELRREGSDWWLVDLDSTNGTELNGKRVPSAREALGRRHDHARRPTLELATFARAAGPQRTLSTGRRLD